MIMYGFKLYGEMLLYKMMAIMSSFKTDMLCALVPSDDQMEANFVKWDIQPSTAINTCVMVV